MMRWSGARPLSRLTSLAPDWKTERSGVITSESDNAILELIWIEKTEILLMLELAFGTEVELRWTEVLLRVITWSYLPPLFTRLFLFLPFFSGTRNIISMSIPQAHRKQLWLSDPTISDPIARFPCKPFQSQTLSPEPPWKSLEPVKFLQLMDLRLRDYDHCHCHFPFPFLAFPPERPPIPQLYWSPPHPTPTP